MTDADNLLDEATRLADGLDAFDEWYAEARVMRALVERVRTAEADVAEYAPILDRQGELLAGVANALRGDPPPLTTWSHHDLPELAAEARGKLDKVRAYAEASRDSGMDADPYDVLAILDGKEADV